MAATHESTTSATPGVRFVDAWLHPRLRRAAPEELRQARLIVAFFAIGSLVLGGALIARYVAGDHVLLLERALASVSLAIVPICLRCGVPVRIVRDLALLALLPGLSFIIWASGGVTSKALYLYIMLPFFSGVIEGGWKSVLWMLVAVGAAGTFYILDAVGITFAVRISPHAFQLDFILLVGATLTVMVSSIVFTRIFRKNRHATQTAAKRWHELNEELVALNADTARLAEAKHAFVGHILHEVSGPVQALADAAQGLPHRVAGNEELARCAAIIARSGEHLATLAEGMTRLDETPISERTAPSTFDLGVEVAGLGAFFLPLATARDAGLTCVVAPTLSTQRVGNAHQLRQIIVGLVLPALDRGRGGAVRFEVSGDDAAIVLEVTTLTTPTDGRGFQRDSGVGVAVASKYVRALGGTLENSTLPAGGVRDRAIVPISAVTEVAS